MGILSKVSYLHCLKILSKKCLIRIFDDIIANEEFPKIPNVMESKFSVDDYAKDGGPGEA